MGLIMSRIERKASWMEELLLLLMNTMGNFIGNYIEISDISQFFVSPEVVSRCEASLERHIATRKVAFQKDLDNYKANPQNCQCHACVARAMCNSEAMRSSWMCLEGLLHRVCADDAMKKETNAVISILRDFYCTLQFDLRICSKRKDKKSLIRKFIEEELLLPLERLFEKGRLQMDRPSNISQAAGSSQQPASSSAKSPSKVDKEKGAGEGTSTKKVEVAKPSTSEMSEEEDEIFESAQDYYSGSEGDATAVDDGATALEEDVASAVYEDVASAVYEDVASAVYEEFASAEEEDESTVEEEAASVIDEEGASAIDEEDASTIEDESPSAVEEGASAVEEESPSAVEEESPSAVEEESPSAVEEGASAVEEESVSAVEEESASAVEEESASAVEEESASAAEEESPSVVEEESTSAVEEEEAASAIKEEGATALEEERATARKEERVTAQEKQSEYVVKMVKKGETFIPSNVDDLPEDLKRLFKKIDESTKTLADETPSTSKVEPPAKPPRAQPYKPKNSAELLKTPIKVPPQPTPRKSKMIPQEVRQAMDVQRESSSIKPSRTRVTEADPESVHLDDLIALGAAKERRERSENPFRWPERRRGREEYPGDRSSAHRKLRSPENPPTVYGDRDDDKIFRLEDLMNVEKPPEQPQSFYSKPKETPKEDKRRGRYPHGDPNAPSGSKPRSQPRYNPDDSF